MYLDSHKKEAVQTELSNSVNTLFVTFVADNIIWNVYIITVFCCRTMNNPSTTLAPLFGFLEYTLTTAQTTFDKLPGSAVIQRYVKSSHQNDPGRTLLELILVVFAIRTLLQSRTRAEKSGKHFIQFSGNVCLESNANSTYILILVFPFLRK